MTPQQVEEKVIELIHREPFVPFVVEFEDGKSLEVPHPRLAINGHGSGFIGPDGGIVDFEFEAVRAIRSRDSKSDCQCDRKVNNCRSLHMTPEQVEEKVIELIHREPFVPFTVELVDGQVLEILEPGLAINGGGAVFFGPDDGLVDFEFRAVRDIRLLNAEAVT